MNFVVYGKSACPGCDTVKNAIDMAGLKYVYLDVMKDEAAMDFMMEEGHRSVPQVYLNGFYIGGPVELVNYLKSL